MVVIVLFFLARCTVVELFGRNNFKQFLQTLHMVKVIKDVERLNTEQIITHQMNELHTMNNNIRRHASSGLPAHKWFSDRTNWEQLRMESRILAQRGNTLEINLSVTNYNTQFISKLSPEYRISGLVIFQVKTITAQVVNGHTNIYNNLIFVRFLKVQSEENMTYSINLSSKEFGISDKHFTCDDIWHLIHEKKKQQYTFDLAVSVDIKPYASTFASLHTDTELTDFELRGEDGSVRIHRAVLAAFSPVLRRMLSGTWRETTEGHVNIAGTSKKTLQHFKNYVYLHVLPDTDLEQILLLASYYIMPDLEQKCVDRLVANLTPQNACELLEFASKHKVTRLLLSILECVQTGVIQVNEMRDHLMQSK